MWSGIWELEVNLAEVLKIIESLGREDVDYAIFGGVALNLHGIVRATEDLDIFVRPDLENLKRLQIALRSIYDDPNIDDIDLEELLGDYPAVRYYPPELDGHQIYIDILTRLGEFASFEQLEIQEIDIEGIRARLVSPRTLHWMKRDTVRDKDRADAALIREKFGIVDVVNDREV